MVSLNDKQKMIQVSGNELFKKCTRIHLWWLKTLISFPGSCSKRYKLTLFAEHVWRLTPETGLMSVFQAQYQRGLMVLCCCCCCYCMRHLNTVDQVTEGGYDVTVERNIRFVVYSVQNFKKSFGDIPKPVFVSYFIFSWLQYQKSR